MNNKSFIDGYTGTNMLSKLSPDFAQLLEKKYEYIKEAFGEKYFGIG